MAINETVLSLVLQFVFDSLASQDVITFFHRSNFNQSLVQKLKTLLLTTETLLLDAEEKQITDCAVNVWVEEVKHWFYRAEEVADQIATQALLSSLQMEFPSDLETSGTEVCNTNLAFRDTSLFLTTVNLNIREIVQMLEIMLSQKDALGLRELSVLRVPQIFQTTSFLNDSVVYGRDGEKDKILQFLLSKEAEMISNGVAAIVGVSGLGKTTLAKMVYNDASVQETFDLKAWVSVSEKFDISQLTESLIELVTHQPTSGSLNVLQTELRSALRDKKFLLVLDDVGNEKYDDWEVLSAPFSPSAIGSKIIVTKRNRQVASTIRSKLELCLEPLSHDIAWSLFSRHAFEDGSVISDALLEQIGKKIVQKCQGLPLAIKTLGSLLHGRYDVQEWEAILQSSFWDLPYNKINVIPALLLSCYYLPPYLKRCFSYCSIFPKGYKIDRKQLVFLWMAENLILPTDNEKRIEDVGDDYLSQLISRSFLESIDETHVAMHDSMHDLAQSVCGNFLTTYESEKAFKIYEGTRHFSYVVDEYDVITKFQSIHGSTFLRTFLQLYPNKFSYITSEISTVLKLNLSCLRVLSLSGYRNLRLLELLECPKQLRYLDISRTMISELPEWVSTLCKLQTLILSDCINLKRLPDDMWRLVSLRHLDIRGAYSLSHMPKWMSKLKNLQTLTDFVVGKNIGSSIQELRELHQIRGKFAIRELQNVTALSDADDHDLSSRKLINDLELDFDWRENRDPNKDRDLLESLKPPSDMKRLTIINYAGATFPKWLYFKDTTYEKMVFLCLSGCHCISLPPLGQLSSLKKLEIEDMDNIIEVVHEFFGHMNRCAPFPSLESLSFMNMKGWKRWLIPDVESGMVCFPCLTKLSLRGCPKLNGDMPVRVPNLKEVEIYECEELHGLLPCIPSIFELEVVRCPCIELSISMLELTSMTTLILEGLVQLVELPRGLSILSSLNYLEIRSCANLKSLAKVRFPSSLKSLYITECEVLECLPDDLGFQTDLRELSISWCPSIKLVTRNSLPTSLTRLDVEYCERFPVPTEIMQYYTSLETLHFSRAGCHFVSFPLGIFPNLKRLSFSDCKDLEKVYIPEGIVGNNLTSLSSLFISGCPKLAMVGKETASGEATVLHVPNLSDLCISGCEKVKPMVIEMEGEVLLPKLRMLTIGKSSKMITTDSGLSSRRNMLRFSCLTRLEIRGEEVELFPDNREGWGSLSTSLLHLTLEDFPKLRRLDGKALQTLTSLKGLYIRRLPKLESLPEEGLPHSLGFLSVDRCPMVEERCLPEKGLDWSKIAHIPCIKINCK